jgi:hypothetical protein
MCAGCGATLFQIGRLCPRCAPKAREAKRQRNAVKSRPRERRQNQNRNPEHLAWIRSLQCAIRGCSCRDGSQAAHVRVGTGGGMGLKPPDRYTVPLCHEHHREQHQVGHRAFDEKHGIDLRALAEELAALSPHLKG